MTTILIRFFLGLLLLVNTLVKADVYQVLMPDANWETISDKDSCRLEQKISGYGHAEFVHRVGESLQFSIQESRLKPDVIKADLVILPPSWIHDKTALKMYPVHFIQSEQGHDFGRLSVYNVAAEVMIDALLQGYSPTFTYVRGAVGVKEEEIRVAVSPVKFQEAYESFAQCRTK